jgi:hypothetical protein
MGHVTFWLLSVKSPTSGKLTGEKLESVKNAFLCAANYASLSAIVNNFAKEKKKTKKQQNKTKKLIEGTVGRIFIFKNHL